MEKKKYEVTVLEKKGSLENELFEIMAKNGDITATKLSDLIGATVKIIGLAKCNIKTEDKDFNINYYDTEEYGLISSGSEVFASSVEAYFGKVSEVRLTEIKTNKGKTYKAVPILSTKKNEESTYDELPF